MSSRPKLPRPLERAVLVEAGHRCAIPTCRQVPVEIHHIREVAKGGKDEFDNLIALCRNCHGLQQQGRIDRQACYAYKRNLAVVSGRYGTLERRVLQAFVDDPGLGQVELDGSHALELSFLLRDGLIFGTEQGGLKIYRTRGWAPVGVNPWIYQLTEAGTTVIEQLRKGRLLDEV